MAALVTVVATALCAADLPRDALWPHSAHELAMTIQIPQGLSVRNGGDIDGDGVEDFLVTTGSPEEPFAVLFGPEFSPGLTRWDDPTFRATRFTFTSGPGSDLVFWPLVAASAGDVNSDGFSDFLLGTFAEIEPLSEDPVFSWVCLILGAPDLPGGVYELSDRLPEGLRGTKLLGPAVRPDLFADRTGGSGRCACVVDGGGDLNADGRQDVVLGVNRKDVMPGFDVRYGTVIVLFGRDSWPPEANTDELIAENGGYVIEGSPVFPFFPLTACHVGDIDGDGLGDLAISGASFPALQDSMAALPANAQSWIIFGGEIQPGDRRSLEEIEQTQWWAERMIVTGGAGDVDKDGSDDVLFFTLPAPWLPYEPSQGGILYGDAREALAGFRSPEDLVEGFATFLENVTFTSEFLLTDPGVKGLTGGRDVSGDGIVDILAAYPTRDVYRGTGANPDEAGQAAIVLGVHDRPLELAPEAPTLEGFFYREAVGKYIFFASLTGRDHLGVGSLLPSEGEDTPGFLLTLLPFPLTPPDALSVDYVQRNSSKQIELLGAGFTDELTVFFGDRAAPGVQLVSHSVVVVDVPVGAPGEEVIIDVMRGGERVQAPATFTYPSERFTPSVDLSRMIGDGVSRIYVSDPDVEIFSGIMAGDIDGDAQNEVVVLVRDRSTGQRYFSIVSHGIAEVESLDIAGDSPLVTARLRLSIGDTWEPVMDAGDFDGDGIADLGVRDRTDLDRFVVVFGGAHLSGEVVVKPGRDMLILNSLPGQSASDARFPGDIDGDGVEDIVCTCWHRSGIFTVIIVNGSASWRDRGEVHAEALLEARQALAIQDCYSIVPAGDLDRDGRADLVLTGHGHNRPGGGGGLVFAFLPGGIPPGLGEQVTFDDLIVQTQGSVKWPGTIKCYLLPKGPFTIDAFGTEGVFLFEESTSLDAWPFAGRLIALAGDAWDGLPESLRPDLEEPVGAMSIILAEEDVLLLGPNDEVELNGVGDFNGDGADDVIVPVKDWTKENPPPTGNETQRAYLLFGGAELTSGQMWPVTALGARAVELAVRGADIAGTLSPACDMNDDGFSDVLLRYKFRGENGTTRELFLILGRQEPLWLPPDRPFRRGDTNQDGTMNLADGVYILQNLFVNGPAILCPDAADSNDDETVNLADAVYILQHLFADGPAVPAPHPDCGIDPTGSPHGGADLPPCDYCPQACHDPPVACPQPR